ncbi:DOMON-like domain-containing protein [Rhodoligotrophos ferricapiens]|uniref:DOMON-like domain-containing protein n=1 Tax=Rhodoligotrophos ferricapiens TaxID=3069264 RepID=UPI00315D6035
MRRLLRLHPDSYCSAATRIEVEITRPHPSILTLSYIVTGRMNDIRIFPVVESTRRDELWRHTCFEAFVRALSGSEYYEFNFAPSTQWAAYRFSGYRSGMVVADEISAPTVKVQSAPDCYTLQVSLELDRLGLPRESPWQLGLSALIEDTSGLKSYWGLAHPPGKPDFHHKDSFEHEFSPVMQQP